MMTSHEYVDRASVEALGKPDPEYMEYLENNPQVDFPWNDMPALRQMASTMSNAAFEMFKRADVKDSVITVTMRDGYESTVAIFTPVSKPEGGSPLVVLLYGGGFLIGTCKDMAVWARACVTLYGATVVCPSYRLGPENKFPAAQNDVWDTLRWSIDNAASLGADPRKGFVLGGTSAGGQLSAVTAQKYVGEKLAPPLTGIWLSIPAILAHDFPPPKEYQDVFFSRDQNADAPILTSSAIDMIDEVYAMDHSSDMFSPFNAKNPHVGLPPTYFQVDGLDPLRDDGLIYERVLRAHSVTTRIDVYPGLPHSHWSFFPGLRSTVKAQTDIVKGLGWLLGQDASPDKIVHVLTPSVAL